MNTREYYDAIIGLNESYLLSNDYSRLITLFGFGLIEETTEFFLALESASEADIIKEAGDVLAYTVLLLEVVNRNGTTLGTEAVINRFEHAMSLFDIGKAFGANEKQDVMSTILGLAGNLKRAVRGDEHLDVKSALTPLAIVVSALANVSDSDIMSANIQKLVSRKQKNTLYSGRGDNR
jgi:NTP pyrophosphatase (non-canonical NTP hydrolase)